MYPVDYEGYHCQFSNVYIYIFCHTFKNRKHNTPKNGEANLKNVNASTEQVLRGKQSLEVPSHLRSHNSLALLHPQPPFHECLPPC